MENAGDRTLYWYSIWRGTPDGRWRAVHTRAAAQRTRVDVDSLVMSTRLWEALAQDLSQRSDGRLRLDPPSAT